MRMDKTTAWMLRRDGIAFPCQWHDYGNADPAEVEETLYAAETDTITVL
jgi:coenzyme F420-reducing hydrogenase delta subunit